MLKITILLYGVLHQYSEYSEFQSCSVVKARFDLHQLLHVWRQKMGGGSVLWKVHPKLRAASAPFQPGAAPADPRHRHF